MDYLIVVTVLIAAFGCNSMHASELCLRGDFDQQFSLLLQNVMLSDEQAQVLADVCHYVAKDLNNLWPGTRAEAYGSIATGLGMKDSDVDCMAYLPPSKSSKHIIADTFKLFLQRPDVYQQIDINFEAKVPVIQHYHVPAKVYCDVTFRGPAVVENSKLMRYFMSLDDRVRRVTAFLKLWAKTHQVTGRSDGRLMLSNYGLVLLSVFYFQQKGILPPVYQLQKDADARFIDGWNQAFDKLPHQNNNTDTIYELLRGFFEYYSEFNFKEYVVSPFVGRPVAKSLFEDEDTLPHEYVLYKHNIKRGSSDPADTREKIWIQDPFNHSTDVAGNRSHEMPSRLMRYLRKAARAFKDLPRDDVLRAILGKDELSDHFRDSVNDRRDCSYDS